MGMFFDRLREVAFRLRNVLLGSRLESDMNDELQFHVEMQTEQFVRSGMPRVEARRRALIKLGGLEQTREQCRDVAGIRFMHDFYQDLRYAIRVLLRSPGFTIVAVLTLALGIGANTAVFSVVNTLILQPLPFDEPDRLVMLWENNPKAGFEREQVAFANFFDWQARNQSFESMGYVVNHMAMSRNFLLKSGDDAARIRGRHVSSGMFDALGVAPLFGERLSSADDEPGGLRRAVLSHSLWIEAYGADPDVIGRSLDVGHRQTYQIAGVMPSSFRFPQDADVWLSVSGFLNDAFQRRMRTNRIQHGMWVIGRLKADVSVSEANAELNTIQSQIYDAVENRQITRLASDVTVTPLLDQVNGSKTQSALFMLLGAVCFVLLIASANVANLLLARAVARRREIAIRSSLGAGRWRVIRQLLTESLLLSLLGGTIAVFVALWGINLLDLLTADNSYLGVKELRFDRIAEVEIDLRVLFFTVTVAVVTGVVFGLIPAIQAARLDINTVLKEDSRSGTPGPTTRFLRNALLVSEVALALVLLSATGMAVRGFAKMRAINPGLTAAEILQADLDLDMAKQVYGLEPYESFDEVLRRVSAIPGVTGVGACGETILVKSGWNETFQIVDSDQENLAQSNLPATDVRMMSPGTFRALGIPLLSGRDFDSIRDARGQPAVAIINESFAEKFFPGSDPVGRKFRMRGMAQSETEIIGVVGNVRNYSNESADRHEIYYPFQQQFMAGPEIGPACVIRVQGDRDSLIPAIRNAVNGSGPNQEVLVGFRKLDGVLETSASQERFQTVLLGSFSGVAVLLAMIGVYGVMSYTTSVRIREFGIRIALGAQPGQILLSVVTRGAALCAVGIAIGITVAFALAHLLRSFVFGLDSLDFATLGAVSAILFVVGVAASVIPAWNAMRIDALEALRHE
jgi:predicted permease